MGAVLTADRIGKTFATATAVDDLSFDVQPGEIFALLGPNGAGKTTTVRMLVHILLPDRGSVKYRLDGAAGDRYPADRIGYLPEERGLYGNMKLFQSLVYFGTLRGLSARQAARRADRWLERFELLERKNEKASSLSKGNQQKVQFIAAMLHEPSFAILDEPFSGLDPVNQTLFLEILDELRAGGMTILLSAHQMNLVERIADRILLMNRGRRVLYGTLDEIRLAAGAREKLIVRSPVPERAHALADHPAVLTVEEDGRGLVSLLLHGREQLPALLHEVADRLAPEDIRLDRLDLHDIYVGAVSSDPAASAAPENAEGPAR